MENKHYEDLKKKYVLIFFDTETTGFQGIAPCDDNNRMIQIYAQDEKGDVFSQICDPMFTEFQTIPPESSKIHRITPHIIKISKAKPSDTVAKMFVSWIKNKEEQTGKQAMLIAHNIPFDQTVLFKHLIRENLGKECEQLNWLYFDTLTGFKKYFPEIERQKLAKQRPFNLGNLYTELNPGQSFLGHNAEADIKALKSIFGKLIARIGHSDMFETKCLMRDIKPKYPLIIPLMDVKGMGEITVKKIVEHINKDFQMTDYEKYMTTIEMVSVYHLLAYGRKHQLRQAKSLGEYEDDDWFNIARNVEKMLRVNIGVYSDGVILTILSYLLNVTPLELKKHTMKNSGDTLYFPTTSGDPCAYLPWVVSTKEASKLKKMGLNSFNEIYSHFSVSKNKYQYVDLLKNLLDRGSFVTVDKLEGYFNQHLKFQKKNAKRKRS